MKTILQTHIAQFFGVSNKELSELRTGKRALPASRAVAVERDHGIPAATLSFADPCVAHQALTGGYCRALAAWAGMRPEDVARLAAGEPLVRRAGWWEAVAGRTGVPLVRLVGCPGAAVHALSCLFITYRQGRGT